jgi:hypothetical protein
MYMCKAKAAVAQLYNNKTRLLHLYYKTKLNLVNNFFYYLKFFYFFIAIFLSFILEIMLSL